MTLDCNFTGGPVSEAECKAFRKGMDAESQQLHCGRCNPDDVPDVLSVSGYDPEIIDRLRQVQKDITQKEFASKLGLKKGHIEQIYKGLMPLKADIILKLHAVFGVDPTWLITGKTAAAPGDDKPAEPKALRVEAMELRSRLGQVERERDEARAEASRHHEELQRATAAAEAQIAELRAQAMARIKDGVDIRATLTRERKDHKVQLAELRRELAEQPGIITAGPLDFGSELLAWAVSCLSGGMLDFVSVGGVVDYCAGAGVTVTPRDVEGLWTSLGFRVTNAGTAWRGKMSRFLILGKNARIWALQGGRHAA